MSGWSLTELLSQPVKSWVPVAVVCFSFIIMLSFAVGVA